MGIPEESVVNSPRYGQTVEDTDIPDGIPEESFVNSRVLGWHEADRPIAAPMPGHGDIRREILKESFLILDKMAISL